MKKSMTAMLALFLLTGIAVNLYSLGVQEKPKMITEIVTIKYIRTSWAGSMLQRYLSPFGRIHYLPQDNKIVIEDTPEMVAKILSILKELDVKPVDLQFNVELILGTTSATEMEGSDKELRTDSVMKELRSLLKYKHFKRLDSSIIKVQDNSRSYQRIGGDGMSLKLQLEPRFIKEDKGDSFRVELRLSQYRGINEKGNEITLTLIDTTLALKSGERSVVGVSKLNGGDKALIMILSGKVLK